MASVTETQKGSSSSNDNEMNLEVGRTMIGMEFQDDDFEDLFGSDDDEEDQSAPPNSSAVGEVERPGTSKRETKRLAAEKKKADTIMKKLILDGNEEFGGDARGAFQQTTTQVLYHDLFYITQGFSNLMSKEVKRREMEVKKKGAESRSRRNWSSSADRNGAEGIGAMRRAIDERRYVFNTTLREQNHTLYPGELLHEDMSIDPESAQEVLSLITIDDIDWTRAVFFKEHPSHVFFLPGSREFKMVPGPLYNFISSDMPTKAGMTSNLEDPMMRVADCKLPGITVRYIHKKSVQWTVPPMTTDRTLELFKYLKEMLVLRENEAAINKEMKNKKKKSKKQSTLEEERYLDDFLSHETAVDEDDSFDNLLEDDGFGGDYSAAFSPGRPVGDEVEKAMIRDLIKIAARERNVERGSILHHCKLVFEALQLYKSMGPPASSESDSSGDGFEEDSSEVKWTLSKIREEVERTIGETKRNEKKESDLFVHHKVTPVDNHITRRAPGISVSYQKADVAGCSKIPFDHTTGVGRLVTMVFCHDWLKVLYPLYSKKQLIRLPADNLRCLWELTSHSPASLCFYGNYSQYILDSKGRKLCNLPEIPEEKYLTICEDIGRTDNVEEKMAVHIYRVLKDRCVQKGDKFIPLWQLYLQVGRGKKDIFKNAIRYLCESKAISCIPNPETVDLDEAFKPAVDTGDGEIPDIPEKKKAFAVTSFPDLPDNLVMLSHVRCLELMTINGMRKVFENYRKGPPKLKCDVDPEELLYPKGYDPSNEPTEPSHEKCSEQIRICESVVTYPSSPVDNLNGWGGSGKTAGLWYLANMLAPNSFVVLTAQAANAAGCKVRVHFNSQTIHMLLLTHSRLCPKSPYLDKIYRESCRKYPRMNKEEMISVFPTLEKAEQMNVKFPMQARGIRFRDSRDKCFLCSITTLIIDEISLVDDELFAALVYVLSTCGNLKQIIFCGDHRQKPQISWGCLLEDLRLGFRHSITPFTHCHRFESGVLFTNAQAIHDGLYNNMIFDNKRYILLEAPDMPSYMDQDMVRERYDILFDSHDMKALPTNLFVTLTNKRKNILSSLLRTRTFGSSRDFYKDQKIYLKLTDNEAGFVHKQILVVLWVEDTTLAKGVRKTNMKREAVANYVGPSAGRFPDTTSPPSNFRTSIRRLMTVPLSIYREGVTEYNDSDYVKVPYFGRHVRLVEDASVVTSHFVQGSEIPDIYIDQTSYWAESDNRRVMFTCVTRGSRSVTFISSELTLKQWCKNAHQPRLSVMWAEFEKIVYEHTEWLMKEHKKRRRSLESRGIKSGTAAGAEYLFPHHLVKNPSIELLNHPPSRLADLKAAEEGDIYDAQAMVAKQVQQRKDKAQRKYDRAVKRAKKEEKRKRKREGGEVTGGEKKKKKKKTHG